MTIPSWTWHNMIQTWPCRKGEESETPAAWTTLYHFQVCRHVLVRLPTTCETASPSFFSWCTGSVMERFPRKVCSERCADFREIRSARLTCSSGSCGASVVSFHQLERPSWGKAPLDPFGADITGDSNGHFQNKQGVQHGMQIKHLFSSSFLLQTVMIQEDRCSLTGLLWSRIGMHLDACRVPHPAQKFKHASWTRHWLGASVLHGASKNWKVIAELSRPCGSLKKHIWHGYVYSYNHSIRSWPVRITGNMKRYLPEESLSRFGHAQILESSSDLDSVVSAVQRELVSNNSLTTLHCQALQEVLQKPDLDKAGWPAVKDGQGMSQGMSQGIS